MLGLLCELCKEEITQVDPGMNAGCRKGNPVPRHLGCNNAMLRLDSSAETDEQIEALKKLKKDKEAYALKVLQLRHQHLAKHSHQRNICVVLLNKLVIQFQATQRTGINMLESCKSERPLD